MNAIPNNTTLPEKCRKKAYEKLVQLAEHYLQEIIQYLEVK